MVKLDYKNVLKFITQDQLNSIEDNVNEALLKLLTRQVWK